MRRSGFAAVAKRAGLASRHRVRQHWHDIRQVVEEVLQFMQQQQDYVRVPEVSTTVATTSNLTTKQQQQQKQLREQRSQSSGINSTQLDSRQADEPHKRTRRKETSMDEMIEPESPAAQDAVLKRPTGQMPKVQQLKEAGRSDLLYGINLHGYVNVAELCGLEHSRQGLSRGQLQVHHILEALAAGCGTSADIHAWVQEQGIAVSISTVRLRLKAAVEYGQVVKLKGGAYTLH